MQLSFEDCIASWRHPLGDEQGFGTFEVSLRQLETIDQTALHEDHVPRVRTTGVTLAPPQLEHGREARSASAFGMNNLLPGQDAAVDLNYHHSRFVALARL